MRAKRIYRPNAPHTSKSGRGSRSTTACTSATLLFRGQKTSVGLRKSSIRAQKEPTGPMPQSLPRRKQTPSARRSAGLESLKANKTRRRAAAWPPFARYLAAGTAGTGPAQGAVKWQTGGQRNRPPVLHYRHFIGPTNWNLSIQLLFNSGLNFFQITASKYRNKPVDFVYALIPPLEC